jgi:hypothetical protein
MSYLRYSEVLLELSYKMYEDYSHVREAKIAAVAYCLEEKKGGRWDRRLDPHHQLSLACTKLLNRRRSEILAYAKAG